MRVRLCLGRGGRVAALAAVYAGGGGAALACGELFSSGAAGGEAPDASDGPPLDADPAGDASDGPDADAAPRPRCDLGATFGAAVSIDGDAGIINTAAPASNYGAWLSDDELTIFFTRRSSPALSELYTATRRSIDASFETATPVKITDAGALVESPSLPSSQARLFFSAGSDRLRRIYVAVPAAGGGAFHNPVRLTDGSTGVDETTPFVRSDGAELFFSISPPPPHRTTSTGPRSRTARTRAIRRWSQSSTRPGLMTWPRCSRPTG